MIKIRVSCVWTTVPNYQVGIDMADGHHLPMFIFPPTEKEKAKAMAMRLQFVLDKLARSETTDDPDVNGPDVSGDFITLVNLMSRFIHAWAVGKGFWPADGKGATLGEKLMLVTDEVSEWHDWYRNSISGNAATLVVTDTVGVARAASDHIPAFSGEEEEAADVVIRVMDICVQRNLRLGEAIVAKMLFNEGRPHKHGKVY